MMNMAHDIVIIGGGVTGCSVLFELTCRGYRCQLLEKNDAIVSEASAGNSGMLHTGFDVMDNSIELDCIRRCQFRVFNLSEKLGVPVNKIGATMVAWNEDQLSRFQAVISKCENADFHDIKQLSMSQLYQKECNLHSGARGAIWIPGEAVTDPWLLPVLLANDAKSKGAEIVTNARVESCNWEGNGWEIVSTHGISRAKCAINCAGLYGDIIDCLAGKTQFSIKPRKGQFTVYHKTAKDLINSSIVPVPSKIGKGVIVFRSIYDNVIVGPTAQDCGSRLRAPVDGDVCQQLYTVADKTVPQLNMHKVVGYYTGVRPATQYKDYVISADKDRNWITVGGIRSTGLSGCLGIAEIVHDLTENTVGVEPSRGSCFTVSSPCVTFTQSGSAMIDGQEYSVRHPLTRFGKMQSLCKL